MSPLGAIGIPGNLEADKAPTGSGAIRIFEDLQEYLVTWRLTKPPLGAIRAFGDL